MDYTPLPPLIDAMDYVINFCMVFYTLLPGFMPIGRVMATWQLVKICHFGHYFDRKSLKLVDYTPLPPLNDAMAYVINFCMAFYTLVQGFMPIRPVTAM